MIEAYYGWGYFTGNQFISGKTLTKKQLPGLDTLTINKQCKMGKINLENAHNFTLRQKNM